MSEQTTDLTAPTWELPDRLRRALRHADVGVQEMAEYLEVSRNTVGSWINGHHRPPATAMKLWAMRCGVPYEWISHGDQLPRQVPDDYGPAARELADIPTDISTSEPPSTRELAHRLRKSIPLKPIPREPQMRMAVA